MTGVTSTDGFIMIGVADPAGASKFIPKPGPPFLPAQQGRVVKTLTLPPGRYAVAVYHDRDNSGKLETGAFGIPKEPVGFSNNPAFLFGPPSFDAASIELDDTARQLTIELVEMSMAGMDVGRRRFLALAGGGAAARGRSVG